VDKLDLLKNKDGHKHSDANIQVRIVGVTQVVADDLFQRKVLFCYMFTML